MNKIKSNVYLRSVSSIYIREILPLIRVMEKLGVLHDVDLRKYMSIEGKVYWKLTLEAEVRHD